MAKSKLILEQGTDFLFRVKCQGGTYVRTLIDNLGKELGSGAHMLELRRTNAGIFFEDDKKYLWSTRDNINKWITNGIKYYLLYGRSNHMWLIYNKANYPNGPTTLIHEHEHRRQKFRDWCRRSLNLSLGINGFSDMAIFDQYLLAGNFIPEFIEFLNYEKVVANYYRYINGEDQQVIYDTQNEWKYVEDG